MSQFKGQRGGSVFLFYSGPPLTGRGPPTSQTAICYPWSTDATLISKRPQRNTPSNIWSNIWALHGPVKLINNTNHNRSPLFQISAQAGFIFPKTPFFFKQNLPQTLNDNDQDGTEREQQPRFRGIVMSSTSIRTANLSHFADASQQSCDVGTTLLPILQRWERGGAERRQVSVSKATWLVISREGCL